MSLFCVGRNWETVTIYCNIPYWGNFFRKVTNLFMNLSSLFPCESFPDESFFPKKR